MLKIETLKKDIEINGLKYSLRVPTYKDSKKYNEELDACGDDSQKKVDVLFNYLEQLGLPKEVCFELSLQNVLDVMEYLSGQKKS